MECLNRRICNKKYFVYISGPQTEVHFADGPSVKAGRVEVLYNGTWLSVCNDDNFNEEDARVLCQTMGYSQR